MKLAQFGREFYLSHKKLESITLEGIENHQALAYVYEQATLSKCSYICFFGKQTKPVKHYLAKNKEQATKACLEFLENVKKSLAFRAERKAEQKAKRDEINASEAAPIGTTYVHSWGHDQTNVDSVSVVGHYSRLGVIVRDCGLETVPGSAVSHGMADNVRPVPEATSGPEKRGRLQDKDSLTLEGDTYSRWDGRREYYRSWYA